MSLFSLEQIEKINEVAAKSKEILEPEKKPVKKGINAELLACEKAVLEYFKDSPAIEINTVEALNEYIDAMLEFGIGGIDTETTGLDRIKDHIVGASLYVPGRPECYIPMKHLVPIFDEPYANQLSYEQVGEAFQRLATPEMKLVYANADFDLAMMYKDLKVDLIPSFYADVILAWRCLKENEPDNALKVLYAKYPMKGRVDPKKFSDFFPPSLFPYCKPAVAKLYAANDAKITYDLLMYELPYMTKDNPKCQKHHLEAIADLIWGIEFPLVAVCQNMHRRGMYLDKEVASVLQDRYKGRRAVEEKKLAELVQAQIDRTDFRVMVSSPFRKGADFNPNSSIHVKYLLKDIMGIEVKGSMDKEFLRDLNLPVANQILAVRNMVKLISTYIEKLPKATTPDSRIHSTFKSVGADTGRFSSESPNMQNIPSHTKDIRHMFRATPELDYLQDMDEGADFVSVVVPSINKLRTECGYVAAREIQVGQKIQIKDNGKEVWVNVRKISDSGETTCVCVDV